MSEWSHLANAKHIDRIIVHVKANPETWYAAAWYAALAWQIKAKIAARAAAKKGDTPAAGAAWYAAGCQVVAYDTILALVAWDYAGGLMDLPAEQVKVLALLGDRAALLMYPAIAAMETRCRLTI